jgi:hypothetical protein
MSGRGSIELLPLVNNWLRLRDFEKGPQVLQTTNKEKDATRK